MIDEATEAAVFAPQNWNPENELNILAGVLAGGNPSRLPIVPADFHEPLHEHLYQIILDIQRSGAVPDYTILHAKLNPKDPRTPRIFRLTPDLLHRGLSPNLKILADELIESRRIRHIQTVLVKIHQALHDGRTADDINAAILADLKQHTPATTSQTLADIMPAVIERIEQGHLHGLSTPWPDVDGYLNGLRPGEFTIIAGRPAQGKSLAAQNLATHFTHTHDKHVYFVSMEMPAVQIGTRILSDVTSIEQDALASPKAMEIGGRWGRIQTRMDRLTDKRLHITAKPSQSMAQIAREANALHTKHGLGLVCVDYIQLMRPRDSKQIREQQVGEFARGLKILALELNVPVVGLSQFNRQAGARNSGPPVLSDLRESGSLEQDADNVIGLHLPDPEVRSMGEMHILKARQGRTGVVDVHMATEFARIATPAHGWQRR